MSGIYLQANRNEDPKADTEAELVKRKGIYSISVQIGKAGRQVINRQQVWKEEHGPWGSGWTEGKTEQNKITEAAVVTAQFTEGEKWATSNTALSTPNVPLDSWSILSTYLVCVCIKTQSGSFTVAALSAHTFFNDLLCIEALTYFPVANLSCLAKSEKILSYF